LEEKKMWTNSQSFYGHLSKVIFLILIISQLIEFSWILFWLLLKIFRSVHSDCLFGENSMQFNGERFERNSFP
jgi:hypothetical protein